MPVKYLAVLWLVTFCFVMFSCKAKALDTRDLESLELIDLSDMSFFEKVDITIDQQQLIKEYLNKANGEWWTYEFLDAFTSHVSPVVFARVSMLLDESKSKSFVLQQRERLLNGEPKIATQQSKMVAIDLDRIYEIPIKFDRKNQGLKFNFSRCQSPGVWLDFDGDNEKELIILKGYESQFDSYGLVYDHYKAYFINGISIWSEWLLNKDYSKVTKTSESLPRITGLNNGGNGFFSVLYDKNNELSKSTGLGLIRENSIFFFRVNEKHPEKNHSYILIWSRVSRPYNFKEFRKNESYQLIYQYTPEKDISVNKLTVNDIELANLIDHFSLTFDDGLRLDNLCTSE